MSSNESELVKYFANCFLATKVMVFNEMKFLCDNLDMDFDTIMSGVVMDNRIGNSHTQVPGPDGEYGFGGTCLPKDTRGLAYLVDKLGIDVNIFKMIVEENDKFTIKVPEGMRKEI